MFRTFFWWLVGIYQSTVLKVNWLFGRCSWNSYKVIFCFLAKYSSQLRTSTCIFFNQIEWANLSFAAMQHREELRFALGRDFRTWVWSTILSIPGYLFGKDFCTWKYREQQTTSIDINHRLANGFATPHQRWLNLCQLDPGGPQVVDSCFFFVVYINYKGIIKWDPFQGKVYTLQNVW